MKSIQDLKNELAALQEENRPPEGEAERKILEESIAAELGERRRRALDARYAMVCAKNAPGSRLRIERILFGRGQDLAQIVFRQWTKIEVDKLATASETTREDVARDIIVSAILDSEADMSGIDPKAPDATSLAKRRLAAYIDEVEELYTSIWGDLIKVMGEHNSAVGASLRGKA